MQLTCDKEELPGGTRHWLRLDGLKTPGQDRAAFYFDFLGAHDVPLPRYMDGAVQAVLFKAMEAREDIDVRGPMTRTALYNLGEFQDAIHSFFENQYHHVEIRPDELVDAHPPPRPPRAVCLFSGGVDGAFSLLRHCRQPRADMPPIEAALTLHYRHIADEKGFERLLQRTQPLIEYVGVRRVAARTSLFRDAGQDLLDSFGAEFSWALHNYAVDHEYGLISSGPPYRALALPYGSNPATDHLLSTGSMRIVHVGAAFSRAEKIAFLAQHPIALPTLQVCGRSLEGNCGRCLKCVRTHLSFMAVGVDEVPCFPTPRLPLEAIEQMPIADALDLHRLRLLLAFVEQRGVRAQWVDRLRRRVDAYRPVSKARRLLGKWSNSIRKRLPGARR
jgi:hypothetical protein